MSSKIGKWYRVETQEQMERFEKLRRERPSLKPAQVYFDFDSCDFYIVSADSLSFGIEAFNGYIEQEEYPGFSYII